MKQMLLSTSVAVTLLANQSAAGSLSDPVIEHDLIIQETTSSSSGTALVAILGVVLSIPALN